MFESDMKELKHLVAVHYSFDPTLGRIPVGGGLDLGVIQRIQDN